MAFKQKCKQSFQVGKKVTVQIFGLEYSGEVVEYDAMNVQDAHVTLKNDDGSTVILPVTSNMAIVVPAEPAQEEEEEEQEPVKPVTKKTKK